MYLNAVKNKLFKFAAFASFLILAVLPMGVFIVTAEATPAKNKLSKNAGWALEANSNFAGTVTFAWTEDAARFHLDKMGLTMITRAPSWDVSLYNEVNKNYLPMTYDKWQQRFKSTMSRHTTSVAYKDMPVEISKHSEKILGFGTDKYTLKRLNQKTNVFSKTECWVAGDVQVPSHFAGILHVLFQAPENIKGMPMRVEIPANGRQVPAIEVYKIQPKTFTADEFKPLKGYKKVEDEMALMLDDNEEMGAILGPEPDKKLH